MGFNDISIQNTYVLLDGSTALELYVRYLFLPVHVRARSSFER